MNIKKLFQILFAILLFFQVILLDGQTISINEVMFDAKGPDSYDEFIELFNYGETDISLEGALLIINGSIKNIIGKYIYSDLTFSPNSYALILDNESHTYDDFIPDGTLLITITSSSFGLLNTELNNLFLISESGDTLSSAITTPDQDAGYSEEKIDIFGSDGLANWGNAVCLYGTPGYENSIAMKDFDLAIAEIARRDETSQLNPGCTVEFSIKIKNLGRETISNAEIQFGDDLNRDTILQNTEVVSVDIITVSPGDSVVLYPSLVEVKSGKHTLLGIITAEDDNPENNTGLFDFQVTYHSGSVVINEFMYAPKSDFGGEWIELLNISNDTVNLANWQICDNSSRVEITTTDIMIPPAEYVLLSSNESITDYWDLGGIYVHCEESLPTLNNTEDSIVVRDLCGQVIDSLKYSTNWGYQQGVSLERIDPYLGGDTSENWALCQNLVGGTPGYKNSVAIKDYDLAVSGVGLLDGAANPRAGGTADLYVTIKNLGREIINNAEFYLGVDNNRDSLLQQNEVLYVDILTVEPGDSVVIYPSILDVHSGKNLIIGSIVSEDDDPGNNTFLFDIKVPYRAGCIVINEFMYVPKSDHGGEWIELLNVSQDTVNMIHWTISDNSKQVVITDEDILIPPETYIVLSSDSTLLDYWNVGGIYIQCTSSIPTLNNTSDSIVVRDLCGKPIDALEYSSTWGYQQGVALERINPYIDGNNSDNWALSNDQSGGTPGTRNSRMIKDIDLEMDYIETQPQCVIHGEPVQMNYGIKNTGMNTVYQYSIRFTVVSQAAMLDSHIVFESTIDVLDSLESGSTYTGSQIIETPNGGAYQLFASVICQGDELPENDLDSCLFAVGCPENAIVINEFMYVPKSDWGGEWIELLNVSQDTINMIHWTIADNSNRVVITNKDILIPPETYIVLSSDSTLLDYWNVGGVYIQCTNSIPTLNNTSDSIVIRDLCGKRIDALEYSSTWGYQQGVTLERINPYIDGDNSDNWALSNNQTGGTPGMSNSWMIKNNDLEMEYIETQPQCAMYGEPVQMNYGVKNTGMNTVYQYSVRFTVVSQAAMLDSNIVFESTIDVLDSLESGNTYTGSQIIETISGGAYQLFASVICQPDELTENDLDSCLFAVGYPENSIVINEIMYTPETGETEWFELFNPSSYPVDLNKWNYRDANGKWRILSAQPLFIEPQEFIVVADKQDFLQAYPDFSGMLVVPDEFPVINNSSDSLFLCDAISHTVEQIYFEQSWGGAAGITIERKDPNSPALGENNWGGSISTSGATPGAINSILKYQLDLSIIPGSFVFVDSTVSLVISAAFQIEIKNTGCEESKSFSLELFHDRNEDSHAAPGELVWSIHSVPPLLPDSVIVIDGVVFSERSGKCSYIAMVAMSGDEQIADNVAHTNLLVAYPVRSLILNEFLVYPTSEQTEFVEFVNVGSADINLYKWSLSNKRSAVTLKENTIVSSGEYLVLVKDSVYFDYFPPSDAVIVVPPKWPGLNNTSDKIILKDLTGATIDSLVYDDSWGLKQGVSLEKTLPANSSFSPDGWFLSTAPNGATPGLVNSVTPATHDLSLDSVVAIPETGSYETEFTIRCWFSNVGLNNVPSASLIIYDEDTGAGQPIATEILGSIQTGSMDTFDVQIGSLKSGFHRIVTVLNSDTDVNPSNDSLFITLKVSFDEGALLLSEFMAIPLDIETGSNSISEYVEVYNPGLDNLPLKGCALCDENIGRPAQNMEKKSVSAQGYFIFAADSTIFNFPGAHPENTCVINTFPSLNNVEDGVVLKDPTGKTIDSLRYNSDWLISNNTSMERVFYTNPNFRNNWRLSTSPDGGTPGRVNSVAISKEWKKPGIKVEPNPFSPNGDGFDDEVAILFQLPFPSAMVTMEIYDLMGRLIYQPAKNLMSSSEGAIYWDGSSKHGNKARIGMYVVRCSATDSMSDRTVGYVTTLVVAR